MELSFLDYVGAGLGALFGLAVALYVVACVVSYFLEHGILDGLVNAGMLVGGLILVCAGFATAFGVIAGLGWLVVNVPVFIAGLAQ